MSLPTYIRKRRVANPALYLAEKMGSEFSKNFKAKLATTPPAQLPELINALFTQFSTPGLWMRVMQCLKQWEQDFDGYYINPTKRHVRPFWLIPVKEAEQAITLTAAGTPGDTAKGISFEVDTQGHFEIEYAMFVATSGEFLVEIFDPNIPRFLQNTEIHARTIAGTARRPFIWPESYFVNVQNAKRTIQMNFRNLSANPNTIRWCFHGRRWYHKESDAPVQRAIEERFARMEKTYTYFQTLNLGLSGYPPSTPEGANPPGLTLAAGQVLQENTAPFFQADDQADTEVYYLTAVSAGRYDWKLREKQSGRILANGEVSDLSGWGDGEFPFVLSETFFFERNYVLLFEVRDTSGAPNIIYPTLTGRRLQYA
jgi:hypothetical protein